MCLYQYVKTFLDPGRTRDSVMNLKMLCGKGAKMTENAGKISDKLNLIN